MAKKSALSKALAKRAKKSPKKSVKQAAPQSESYSVNKDKKEKAKPAGYRFKGLGNFKTPTKKDIAADAGKPKSKRKTYFENRKDKSDKTPSEKFAKGGRTKKYPAKKKYEFGGTADLLVNAHDPQHPTEVQDAVFERGGVAKDFRKKTDTLINKYSGKIKTKKGIENFLRDIHEKLELNFHPDDRFESYTDENNNELFTKVQSKKLDQIMDAVFKVADKLKIDVYEVSLKYQQELLKRKGIMKEGGPILPEDMTQADVMAKGGTTKIDTSKVDTGDKIRWKPDPIEEFEYEGIVDEVGSYELNGRTHKLFGVAFRDDNNKRMHTWVGDRYVTKIYEDGGEIPESLTSLENEIKASVVEPEMEVKIETTQKATIPNIESASYAENLIDFMGTNLEGKKLMNGDYVVLSFLYYPIWFYCAKDQKWYGNSDKYNSVTAMHISQSRPTPNAEMMSCSQLFNQMNQGIERYEAGGSILVRQLYPLPYDNTVIAHQ